MGWRMFGIAAVCITAVMQWWTPAVNTYPGDEWLRDRFTIMYASDVPENRITMVDIDETSLVKIGPWPWPRSTIADLIEYLLGSYGARGVALDIFFSEPADVEGDARLAMLAQHGPVVMAQVLDYNHTPLAIGNLIGGIPANKQTEHSAPVISASGFIGNHAGLIQAKHMGNIGFVPDADGVLRHIPPMTEFRGFLYPTLSSALFNCCAQNANTGATSPIVDLFNQKTRNDGFMRVPYQHHLSAFTIIKASDILELKAPPVFLKDKLIILGSSSLNLSDRVTTPLSPSTSGFLVHASVLSGLLDAQAGIAPANWPGKLIATLFSLFVACIAVYTFPRLSALSNSLILGAASFIWLLLAYLICQHDNFFSPTAPLLSNLFLLTMAVPYGWQIAQGKSQRLLGTLQQYVAKAVVDELLRSDLKDPLAPRQCYVTTLIADMEGYTSHVGNLPIEDAATLTRDFLKCLTEPVMAMGGTLDKYTGDGLVAFWGAPLPVENHADLALDAGIEIMNNLRTFNATRKNLGLKPIRGRIGIESGLAMAGDFGTSYRSIYTAVGDSVNVASRLEDAARSLPYDIIVGEGTVKNATRHKFKFLGERVLKGKDHPSKLFTLEVSE